MGRRRGYETTLLVSGLSKEKKRNKSERVSFQKEREEAERFGKVFRLLLRCLRWVLLVLAALHSSANNVATASSDILETAKERPTAN